MMLHLVFLIIILLLYLTLAYVTFYAQGWYVYFFLNPAEGRGKVAAYCVGIAAAIVVVFFVAWVLIWLRRRFTGLGKKSRKDPGSESMLARHDIETREVLNTREKEV